jgi:acyl-CoA synthetase (AMP-forming)/AMP-acid ligase II
MAGAADEAEEGFRDGWYYPGDIGHMGTNGILHLAGRSADLIKRGGLMVHAQEVEQVLRKHPNIIDVAVVGTPSPTLGQDVTAFVEARGSLDLKEITRFCRRNLAGYKIPSRIEIVDALPRNAAGKVVKANLLKTI